MNNRLIVADINYSKTTVIIIKSLTNTVELKIHNTVHSNNGWRENTQE